MTRGIGFEAHMGSQWQEHSSLLEKLCGAAVRYTHGPHQLAYELGWREIVPATTADAGYVKLVETGKKTHRILTCITECVCWLATL
jgi:hypothetical protein